jgi:UDP:flavonoid glycosyltransferase YjiC (YdhE family)
MFILFLSIEAYYVSIFGHPFRGDTAPMLSIASILHKAGHRVSIIMPEFCRSWINESEIEFISLGTGFPSDVEAVEAFNSMGNNITIQSIIEFLKTVNISVLYNATMEKLESLEKIDISAINITKTILLKDKPDIILGMPIFSTIIDIGDYLDIPIGHIWSQSEIIYSFLPEVGILWPLSMSSSKFISSTSTHSKSPLTIFDRFLNMLFDMFLHLHGNFLTYRQNIRREEYFNLSSVSSHGRRNNKKFGELTSFILVNGLWGWSTPVQTSPMIKMVGPLVYNTKNQILQDTLIHFLNENENIILLNLGTVSCLEVKEFLNIINVVTKQLNISLVILARKSVRELIFNETGDNHVIQSKNEKLYISTQWNPQFSILNHKNIKLFISHGGINAVYESILSLKPIICIGIQFDQPMNCRKVKDNNIGREINSFNEIEKELSDSIIEIQNNYELYISNLLILNQVFNETLMNQENIILNTITSAISLNQTYISYFKPLTLDMNFFQYYLIDILFFLFIISSGILFLFLKWLINTFYNYGYIAILIVQTLDIFLINAFCICVFYIIWKFMF